jgi:D-arabinose 1-dehydrogenase-like Zn-dependent alcohol dehydrogenase
MVGAPPGEAKFAWFPFLMKSLTLCSSLVGTLDHTQSMLDFCAEKGIMADVEVRAGVVSFVWVVVRREGAFCQR